MRFFSGVLFLSFLSIIACTRSEDIQLNVIVDKELKCVPSASGMQYVNDTVYAIGDDSPWLFALDTKGRLLDQWLLDPQFEQFGRMIPKSKKMDMECLTAITWKNRRCLLIIGSGSSENRKSAIVFDIANKTTKKISLTSFYDALMRKAHLDPEDLNCEGIAAFKNQLIVLNRTKNKLIDLDVDDFMQYIEGETNSINMKCYSIELPQNGKVQAQFSGADFDSEGQLIFSASLEDTESTYFDGEILGSYVGMIDTKKLSHHMRPMCKRLPNITNDKIEGITIYSKKHNAYKLLLTSDGDGKMSHFFECSLLLN